MVFYGTPFQLYRYIGSYQPEIETVLQCIALRPEVSNTNYLSDQRLELLFCYFCKQIRCKVDQEQFHLCPGNRRI